MKTENYLNVINEDTLISLAKLYLPSFSMPFSRPNVIERLVAFFSSEENKKTILSRISDEESKIISSIYLLQPVKREVIVKIVGEKKLQTEQSLASLEKRLLVLNINDELYTNESFNYKGIVSTSFLKDRVNSSSKRIRESIIAIFSLINSKKFSFNSLQLERQFNHHKIADCFPLLESNESLALFKAILAVGLKDSFITSSSSYAALITRNCDLFLKQRIAAQNAELSLSTESDRKITKQNRTLLFTLLPYTRNETIFLALNLALNSEEFNKLICDWAFLAEKEAECEQSSFTISNDLTITGRSFKGSEIYKFATISKVDTLITYTLTKESIKAAFDLGYDADSVITSLSSLAEVPQLVRERVKDWWASYNKVVIYDSIYVEADKQSSRLISIHPDLQAHIIKRLSETGFLFKRSTESTWREIMITSGLDMIGKTKTEDDFVNCKKEDKVDSSVYSDYSNLDRIESLPEERRDKENRNYENLLRITINEKIKDKTERDGYLNYLKKGYIVSPSQIVKGRVFPSKRSASGFDFQQKLQLLSSIEKREDILVSLTLEEGTIEGAVLSLNKKGENSTIQFMNFEDDKVTTILVSRIFLIKVISD